MDMLLNRSWEKRRIILTSKLLIISLVDGDVALDRIVLSEVKMVEEFNGIGHGEEHALATNQSARILQIATDASGTRPFPACHRSISYNPRRPLCISPRPECECPSIRIQLGEDLLPACRLRRRLRTRHAHLARPRAQRPPPRRVPHLPPQGNGSAASYYTIIHL